MSQGHGQVNQEMRQCRIPTWPKHLGAVAATGLVLLGAGIGRSRDSIPSVGEGGVLEVD